MFNLENWFMKDLKEKEELAGLVDMIHHLLSEGELKAFQKQYSDSLDYVVKNGYPTVILKKYLQDSIFKKITNTLKLDPVR